MEDYFDLGINFTDIATDTRHNRGSPTDEPFARPTTPPNSWRKGSSELIEPYARTGGEKWRRPLEGGAEEGRAQTGDIEGSTGVLAAGMVSSESDFLSAGENAGRYPFPVPRRSQGGQ